MATHDTRHGPDDTTDCSTTTSFEDHGLDDGGELVRETYLRLAAASGTDATGTDGGGRFTPTERFFERLESAFLWSYLHQADVAEVPAHVQTAVDDALAVTAEEFSDAPGADLRTEVLPTFYQEVAGFHCAYR